MSRRSGRFRAPLAIALLTGALTLSGCAMVSLHRDLQAVKELGLITGGIVSPSGGTEDVVVALFRQDRELFILESVDRLTNVIADYAFVLDAEVPYLVAAFHDLDGDLVQDPGEPGAILGEPDPLVVQGEERLPGRDIVLRDGFDLPAHLRFDATTIELPELDSIPVAAGELASLEDERFSRERARRGMWSPLSAIQEVGGGIYFLEPLDPVRVPVIFVHGIQGSPRDFHFLVDKLDRERYQPWVYHYPSGIRLERASRLLSRLILSLHREHDFERLIVVAHSMGGLVARGAVLNVGEAVERPEIPLFVTLSTPWAGHKAAAQGVKYSPAVVPSWIDVQPESGFLATLRRELDDGTRHHLFFGFDTKSNPFMLYSHDTVVTVESQLSPWFQWRAERVYGYDLDHVTILEDEAVAEKLGAILGSAVH